MRTPLTRVLIVAVALALVAVSAWSLRYFRRYQPLADLIPRPSALDQVGLQVTDAVVTGRLAGRRRWRIAARLITFSRDQRQVSVDGIRNGLLLDPKERPLVTLTAGGAVYQSLAPVFAAGNQGFLQVTGGLQARLLRPYGPTVATASLAWDPTHSQVSTSGPVTARFPPHAGAVSGVQLQADSAQWDARTDLLHSPGRVQVVFAAGAGLATGQDVTVDIHTGNLTLHHLQGTFGPARQVHTNMVSRSLRSTTALVAGASIAMAAASLPATPAAPHTTNPVTYDAGASSWLSAPHVVQMSQGVKFTQDDASLETEAAIVNLDDEQHALNAESRAPVHLQDTQDDLTGQRGYIDFTRHVATVQDKITLVVKPGPGNRNAPKGSLRSRFKDPATLTCEKMIYNYRSKTGQVPGALTVRQKDRVLTADSGTYNGRAQIVTLTGHVHGHDHDNLIDAPAAYFGVREGDEFIRIDSHVHGVFKPQSDPNDNSEGQAAPDDQKTYDALKNGGPGVPPAQPPSPGANPGETPPVPAAPASAPPDTPPATGTLQPAAPPSGGASHP